MLMLATADVQARRTRRTIARRSVFPRTGGVAGSLAP
jgi:hypothetical protein